MPREDEKNAMENMELDPFDCFDINIDNLTSYKNLDFRNCSFWDTNPVNLIAPGGEIGEYLNRE